MIKLNLSFIVLTTKYPIPKLDIASDKYIYQLPFTKSMVLDSIISDAKVLF